MADPVTHYAHDTSGLVSDIQPRVACGISRWAVVSEHPHAVTCPDCKKAIVARVLDKARLAVLGARASWAEWASAQCRDAAGNWLPDSDDRWRGLIPADFALSAAESHVEAALAHLQGTNPLALVSSAAEALETARRTAARMPNVTQDEGDGEHQLSLTGEGGGDV
jgi:hypothetical protein